MKKVFTCSIVTFFVFGVIILASCSLKKNEAPELVTYKFTIPEGYTAVQIAETLEKENIISKGAFLLELTDDYSDYDFLPQVTNPAVYEENFLDGYSFLEGYLYPDTYEVFEGEVGSSIIRRMLNNFRAKTVDVIKAVKAQKKSLKDIIIIASMIEKETSILEERPIVASVIYNRLKKNMKLQIDACIQFVYLCRDGKVKENLLYKDLEIDSPYNVYKYSGLPAGPISNPDISSIMAALNPSSTDYIYYVASKKLDGSHFFTASSSEFEKAKKEYYDALNASN